jgi:hypothetical protein
MWMLAFIPDTLLALFVNTVLIAGIVGFAASFFFGFVVRWLPAIAPYHLIIQIVSIILLVSGVYFKGGYSVEMEWRGKVAELEAKVAVAEQKSKDANEQIKTVVVEKIRVVKDTQIVIQEKLKTVEVKIDSQCRVVPEALNILNEAASNPGAKK